MTALGDRLHNPAMNLRALLRKRLHVRIDLRDPALHFVQAQESDGHIGSWFSANFGVGNALSVATLALTIIGGYVSLQSSIVDLKARDDSEQREIQRQQEVITRINQRLSEGFVNHQDYNENNLKISQQFATQQAAQLQIYGTLLAEKGAH